MVHRHKWLTGTGVMLVLAATLALIGASTQTSLAENGIIYVDADATGSNSGEDWTNAYPDLKLALADAEAGEQIWVAEGVYKPTEDGDRTASFLMVNGVAIYGGFDPSLGDTGWEDRDSVLHETILSGDIGTDGNASDNVYHVLRGIEITELAVLDGFTITGGYAKDTTSYDGRFGGGLFAYGAQLGLENLRFEGNTAEEWGGGAYVNNSSATLANVTFSGNTAGHGGGFCVNDSEAALINCTFTDNSASDGGAMYNYNASPSLTNCILWGNSTKLFNTSSTPDISYSDIEGGCSAIPGNVCGDGNIDADPLFVDPDNGDFHLSPSSPCIDAGTNTALNLRAYDFEGDPRILDGDGDGEPTADMGVDEVWGSPPPVIFVDLEAAGTNSGTSWADAFTDLQHALTWAQEGTEIWVAAGIYKPTWRFDAADPRSATFQMANGVAIYGGFAGTETERGQRDWLADPTILSGDIGTDGNASDNVYHVLRGIEITELAVLDGFTITGAYAKDTPNYDGRFGGGLFAYGAQLGLENLRFEGNTAEEWGGGAYVNNSSATLANVTFSGNTAGHGGGFCVNDSEAALINCTFTDNSASDGGAMYNYNASPSLTNCILWGDSTELYNTSSSPVVNFSDVQGGYGGEGNISADPLFVDPDNGDLHLSPSSPCIDAGTNTAPGLPDYDFEGDPRIVDGDGDGTATVDMGVDEAQVRVFLPLVLRNH